MLVGGGRGGWWSGGSRAPSRSLFSQLIRSGGEAEYFGFYAISDNGTSWLGPLLAVPIRRSITAAGNTPPHRP